jgi:hypothetical protein
MRRQALKAQDTNMPRNFHSPSGQRGVTTLVVVLSLLFILTLVVLASSNISLFEQKTTTNENRQKLADQTAEYAINLTGEWLKSNVTTIASKQASANGWLASGGTKRWVSCASITPGAGHPCLAEPVTARRNQMYFYNFSSSNDLPYSSMGGALGNVGGAAGGTFGTTTTVNALLCRVDTTLKDGSGISAPDCRLDPDPSSEARVAITLIATSTINGENASSTQKETWASYSAQVGFAAVPLVASGSIEGLGGGEIVAAANGGGYGLPVSMWSPCPIDIEAATPAAYPPGCTDAHPGGGVGSFQTCQLGEFLKATNPNGDWKAACAASNNACGCPSANQNPTDWMSGHSNSVKRENIDILDQDGNVGTTHGALPDITFFPGGTKYDGTDMDDPNDPLDDSLFEWIFGQDVVNENATAVNTNCGNGSENCALVALRDTFGAQIVANCNGFSATSSGIYYVTGACDFPNGQVGSSTSPVIVVVDGDVGPVSVGGNMDFFGMLFIRSNNKSASLTGNGSPEFYGAVVVEGVVNLTGSMRIVYDNGGTGTLDKGLPPNTRFAKLPGTWLDNATGF